MITQTLQLNLVPKGISPRLYVTQYDYGSRTLTFEIYNSSNRFTLTSGTTAKIQGTKPDRHGFSYDATVDTTNNVITADLTQQMTAVDGEVVVEIVLIKSNKRIGTLNFVMVVQPAGLNDDTDTSDTDLPDIIAEATEQMLTAEAYAKGTRNGTAVTSGQTGYHDNSKYYKEQAATQANNASNSATSANTNALKAEGYAVGKQNGTTQTSGTYYHNNAQYYKEQAASSATTASTKAGEASSSADTASQKASAASTSAQTASDKALVAEGYAKGTQNGTPVGSSSPYYHNNAEYFKDLANPTVAANVSFNNSGTDMSSTNVQDGIVENSTSIQNLSTVVSKNGAKNLLPFDLAAVKALNTAGTWSENSYTYRSVTFTPTLDNKGNLLYVNVDGTNSSTSGAGFIFASTDNKPFYLPSGNYKLNGCPSGGSNSSYDCYVKNGSAYEVDTGNGKDFTVNSESQALAFVIAVGAGATVSNIKFYPMIRLASDTDPTYEPYAKTNQQLTQETTGLIENVNANGCVNLLATDITSRTTAEGVAIVANSDGSYTVSSSSAPTASKTIESSAITLEPGTYYWCCAKDGESPIGEANCFCYLVGINGTSDWKRSYIINESSNSNYGEFTVTQTSSIKFCIRHGTATISSRTYYPMIRRIELKSPYVPFAKSNKELTEDKAEYTAITPYVEDGATASQAISKMNIIAHQGKLYMNPKTNIASGDTLVEGGNLGNAKSLNDIFISQINKLVPYASGATNIFDIIANGARQTIHWGTTEYLTNGSSTLKSLLGTGGNAIVELKIYDDWRMILEITEGTDIRWSGTFNKNSTSFNLRKISYASNTLSLSTVTITKATS